MSTEKKQESGAVRFAKDFVAGTIAGWAQVLVGQPFDTVKVRMQTQKAGDASYKGPIDAVLKIRQHEGLRGFYKGTAIPMLGVGVCVSVQFAAMSQAKKWFLGENVNRKLTYPELFLAGAYAGTVNSVLSAPIEHIRIRLQTQKGEALSPFKLIGQIAKQHGVGSIWKGFGVTAAREFPGFGFYFVGYEAVLQASIPAGKTVNDVPAWKLMLCGALGGVFMWIATYPIDVVKSRVQSDSFDAKTAQYKGAIDCTKYIWKTEGMRGFWKGFAPCMVRAFPVNAATFATYELVIRMMGGRAY